MFMAALAMTCPTPNVSALLDASRKAAAQAATPGGTTIARYAFSGEGLSGEVVSTVDTASGAFLTVRRAGIVQTAEGFDGRRAWRRDMSGFATPQDGGNKPRLAISEAYRNANLWWRADRGGAQIEQIGCDAVRVTPRGGAPFEAWFDPATHLLNKVRETQSFGAVTETRYLDYRRISGRPIARRIEALASEDPSDREILKLSSLRLGAASRGSTFARPSRQPRDWSLPASGRTTVPFQLLNNHIIAQVRIDGGEPLPFLVDTGGYNVITPSTVSALRLATAGASQASGGGETTSASGYVRIQRLKVGGASMGPETVSTFDFSPPEVEGLALGGMLGVEFLERFVVRIDYGAKTLTFVDPAKFSAADRAAAGMGVPFRFYEHLPQVEGTFDGRPVRLDLDTGSRSDVNLTAPFVERAGLRAAFPSGTTVTEGWGAGGPSRAYVGRAGELTLGHVRIPRPIASLSSARHGAFSDSAYDGNVGGGLLKRFVVTFDYANRMVYLAPLAHPDADASRFDRVGIWLNQVDEGVKIMDVAAGSPAEAAGLKVGDVVTAIDGARVSQRTLSDVRRSLKLLAPGKTVVIDYSRGGVPGRVPVVPRNLISD